jgi:hypothetical protein
MDRLMGKETDRWARRQTDGQENRHIDRQIDN